MALFSEASDWAPRAERASYLPLCCSCSLARFLVSKNEVPALEMLQHGDEMTVLRSVSAYAPSLDFPAGSVGVFKYISVGELNDSPVIDGLP